MATKELVGSHADGHYLHASEVKNIRHALNGGGVLTHTISATITEGNRIITLPAFDYMCPDGSGGMTRVSYAGGDITVTDADNTNPRMDLLTGDSAGNVGMADGVATEETGDVDEAPTTSLDDDQVLFATVRSPAGQANVLAADVLPRAIDVSENDGGWQSIVKAADETVNTSDTLQSDDDLEIDVEADTDYLVEMDLLIGSNATADWKYAWTLTGMTYEASYEGTFAGATHVINDLTARASGTSNSTTYSSTLASSIWRATFVIHSGTTGGTLNFQWAQNTSDASDTKVLKNSVMRYRKLGAT